MRARPIRFFNEKETLFPVQDDLDLKISDITCRMPCRHLASSFPKAQLGETRLGNFCQMQCCILCYLEVLMSSQGKLTEREYSVQLTSFYLLSYSGSFFYKFLSLKMYRNNYDLLQAPSLFCLFISKELKESS